MSSNRWQVQKWPARRFHLSANPSESAAISRLVVAGIFFANENFTHTQWKDRVRLLPAGGVRSFGVFPKTNKGNNTARALYERKGFRPTGVEDEDEIELVLMLKS